MIYRALRDLSGSKDIDTKISDRVDSYNWIMSEDMGFLSFHFCVDVACDQLDVKTIREYANANVSPAVKRKARLQC